MPCTRRQFLAAGAGSLLGSLTPGAPAASKPRMGVVIHSYGIRRAADKERRFDDPLAFLDFCRTRGAGGVQTSLGVRDDAYAARLSETLTNQQLYLEGIIALPRQADDVERFAAEVRTAKRCGATVFRTVLMNGRRYEVFDSIEAFRQFFTQARQSLALARPIVEKQEVRMAVENHKDLPAADLVDLIGKLDSPWVGVCLDTGNNIALLETPQETVELLAPHTFTTHVKDMGVSEFADGFLLAEVPLGTGFLDLAALLTIVRQAQPGVRLNLEMITRDPLQVPCLTPRYWTTLADVPGRRLAALLALVRAKASKQPLPRLSELGQDAQLEREDDNVRQCLRYARERLDA